MREKDSNITEITGEKAKVTVGESEDTIEKE
jgi:hypothetical protein